MLSATNFVWHLRLTQYSFVFRSLFPKDRTDLRDELIYRAEVDPHQRSYQFSIEEINRLCHVYQDICNRLPYLYDFDYRNPKSLRDYKAIREVEQELGLDVYGKHENIDQIEEELRRIENTAV